MRPGRRGKRARPVLRDLLAHRDHQGLLAHRDHRGLRARRVLLDRLALQLQRVAKARCGSCAPTARRQRAEASVTRTRF